MKEVRILKAHDKYYAGMEKIHLKYFSDIGESEGAIKKSCEKSESLSLVAVDLNDQVIGYILSSNFRTQNYFEWFGVSEKRKGVAQNLFCEYLKILKESKINVSSLTTRNRFKDAIVFYIKSGYEIKGIYQGNDEDMMIQMRKTLS